jgi:hypothetical protein
VNGEAVREGNGKARLEGNQARQSLDAMLRTPQQHHVQLSVMADTKASILITGLLTEPDRLTLL